MIRLVGWGLLVSWPVTVRRCPDASGLIAMLARAMNCLPPRSGPSIGRWRGRPLKTNLRKGLRLALRFRDEPDAVAAESANSSARRTCG